MCLETKSVRAKTAKKPIRCLKVVAVTKGLDGPVYHSFYAFCGSLTYKIGETIDMNEGRSKPDKFGSLPNYSFFKEDYARRVEVGIHTFVPDCNGARSVYEWGKLEEQFYNKISRGYDEVAILECEIPAGAKYFEGKATCFRSEYNVDERAYVSDKLHIIRALSEEEIKQLPYVVVPY